MCIELQNLRVFFFRLASPKIANCLDKIKTGNHKEKAMKSDKFILTIIKNVNYRHTLSKNPLQ